MESNGECGGGGVSGGVSEGVSGGVSEGVSEGVGEGIPRVSSVQKLRQCTASEEVSTSLRKHVIRGAYTSLQSSAEWRAPTFKLLVFVSSTFTDTQLERNFLIDELLSELREEARSEGVVFSYSLTHLLTH